MGYFTYLEMGYREILGLFHPLIHPITFDPNFRPLGTSKVNG